MSSPTYFFAYGTLVFLDVFYAVVEKNLTAEWATLSNYSAYLVEGEVFPSIKSEQNSEVLGKLYSGLSPEDFDRLDVFEGDDYERISVTVETSLGQFIIAQTYILKATLAQSLSKTPWDLVRFSTSHKQPFLDALSQNP